MPDHRGFSLFFKTREVSTDADVIKVSTREYTAVIIMFAAAVVLFACPRDRFLGRERR